jgi:hypothetical protein
MRRGFCCTSTAVVLCTTLVSNFAWARNYFDEAAAQVAQASPTPLFMYLVGAWRNATGNEEELRYEFSADGSYAYMAMFSKYGIYIHEVGRYRVGDDGVTLLPQKKRYRRNGVDSWDTLKVRTYPWRTYTRGGQRYLDIEMEGSRLLFVAE